MLRKVRQALTTQRSLRRCIALAVGGGLLILFVSSALRVETEAQKTRRLVRDLQTQDSWLRRQRVALWQALPPAVRDNVPRHLVPLSIVQLKLNAVADLHTLGPPATPYLTAALDDPSDPSGTMRLNVLGTI